MAEILVLIGVVLVAIVVWSAWPVSAAAALCAAIWWSLRRRKSVFADVTRNYAGAIALGLVALVVVILLFNFTGWLSPVAIARVETIALDVKFWINEHAQAGVLATFGLLLTAILVTILEPRSQAVSKLLTIKKAVSAILLFLTGFTSFTLFGQIPLGSIRDDVHQRSCQQLEPSLRELNAAIADESGAIATYLAAQAVMNLNLDDQDQKLLLYFVEETGPSSAEGHPQPEEVRKLHGLAYGAGVVFAGKLGNEAYAQSWRDLMKARVAGGQPFSADESRGKVSVPPTTSAEWVAHEDRLSSVIDDVEAKARARKQLALGESTIAKEAREAAKEAFSESLGLLGKPLEGLAGQYAAGLIDGYVLYFLESIVRQWRSTGFSAETIRKAATSEALEKIPFGNVEEISERHTRRLVSRQVVGRNSRRVIDELTERARRRAKRGARK